MRWGALDFTILRQDNAEDVCTVPSWYTVFCSQKLLFLHSYWSPHCVFIVLVLWSSSLSHLHYGGVTSLSLSRCVKKHDDRERERAVKTATKKTPWYWYHVLTTACCWYFLCVVCVEDVCCDVWFPITFCLCVCPSSPQRLVNFFLRIVHTVWPVIK